MSMGTRICWILAYEKEIQTFSFTNSRNNGYPAVKEQEGSENVYSDDKFHQEPY